MDTLGGQVYGFTTTIIAGLSLGLLFDLYRLWRRAIRPAKAITSLSDMLFWVVATPVTYFYLLVGNWAELRFYVLLGLFLGLLLYFGVFSVVVLNLLSSLWYYTVALIGGFFQSLWFLLSIPMEGIFRLLPPQRWRPGRIRVDFAARVVRKRPRWLGARLRFWPGLTFFRK
ncbi:MAG: spore cortex biosynthesis protein YabQ [Firmicutes bacterium]|nr:spore cortex biosynthesis protein YabQ [Bacillota bacterium]